MFSIFTHVMKPVGDTNSEPRKPVVYAGLREIIKDLIYIVTANGLSVKNMFTKEEVIIHLP